MHEYAITKELLRNAREAAKDRGLEYVKKIYLDLGLMTGYEKESILYYFNELKIGGDYIKDAELIVNEVPTKGIKITKIIGEKNGS